MNKGIKVAIIIFQIGLTLIVTFVLYMVFAMFEYQGGITNFIGMTLFQPFFAILLSVLTVILCGLFGLPVRLHKKLNEWWREYFYVSLILSFTGLVFCVVSLTPSFIEEINYQMDGMNMTATVPNQFLSIAGYFLIAFGTLHLFPPKWVQGGIENILK